VFCVPHETRSPVMQQKMPLNHRLLQKPPTPLNAGAKAAFQHYRNSCPSIFPVSPQSSLSKHI